MKKDLMKEERQMLAQTKVKNYFVNFEDGSSVLFYVDQPNIGERTIKKYCEKVTGDKVTEVYHVPQDDLQYYCPDERIWIDAPSTAKRLLEIANS